MPGSRNAMGGLDTCNCNGTAAAPVDGLRRSQHETLADDGRVIGGSPS